MATSSIPLLNEFLKDTNNKTIFEIGAYNGYDIPAIQKIFKNCQIHAFEPDPECFNDLIKYKSEQVHCYNLAFYNKTGILKFNKYYDNTMYDNQDNRDEWFKTAQSLKNISEHHLTLTHTKEKIKNVKINVQCDTLNNFCLQNNIFPQVLLIDTQGSEYEILESAFDILNKVEIITCEYSLRDFYDNQKHLKDIEILLSKKDFKLQKQISLFTEDHGDAIFIK